MKKGSVCRCRCGREYVYTGGRPNPLCPECYRQEKLRRMREYMQEKKRCGGSEKQGAAPAKHGQGPKRKASGKKGARLPMDDTWRRKKKKLCDALVKQAEAGKRVAAICAAPSVLGGLGLLKGKTATCFPGFEDKLEGASYTYTGVVTDGNVTTARGLGYALDLGIELVKLLIDEDKAMQIKASIQYEDR